MQSDATPYLTCSEASKLVPGRPSVNAVWRWCRRGVLARNGQRVRLQHVRMGSSIYTKAEWLDEFGHRPAEADARQFDSEVDDASAGTSRAPGSLNQQRRREIESAERELDEGGIR